MFPTETVTKFSDKTSKRNLAEIKLKNDDYCDTDMYGNETTLFKIQTSVMPPGVVYCKGMCVTKDTLNFITFQR